MQEPYRIVKLASGVHSIHSVAHSETFHPVIGPVAEAEALYVDQLDLPGRMAKQDGPFVIWDVGLGAAANVATVLKNTRHTSCPVRLLSFDHTLGPLEFALEHPEDLDYLNDYRDHLTTLIKTGHASFEDGERSVDWTFHGGDFPSLLASVEAEALPKPDVILFDAYSPAKNPEMWTYSLFARIFELLDPERPCALPTYSRSTMLRVSLLLAGFFVGAGHATGEKEQTTIAANSPELIQDPLDETWLGRAHRSTSAEPLMENSYRQAPLSEESKQRLSEHPQFSAHSARP